MQDKQYRFYISSVFKYNNVEKIKHIITIKKAILKLVSIDMLYLSVKLKIIKPVNHWIKKTPKKLNKFAVVRTLPIIFSWKSAL